MRRRVFLLAVCAAAMTCDALGQRPKKQFRIGVVLTTSPLAEMLGPEPAHPRLRAFIRELRRLGYAEGDNLVIDRRSAEGKFERFGEILAELLRLKPDALVTIGDTMALAAKKLTDTVPIIAVAVADPIGTGLVNSLHGRAGTSPASPSPRDRN